MSQARSRRARVRTLVIGVAAALLLAGCGMGTAPLTEGPSLLGADPSSGAPATAGTAVPGRTYTLHAVDDPGPLKDRLLSADLLVYSNRSLTDEEQRRVMRAQGVSEALPMGLAQVAVDGRTIQVASADPGEYRRYTLANAAQMDEIWRRVAAGEIAVEPTLGKRLEREDGTMALGNSATAPALHIGAFASMVPQVHAVMNPAWGKALGMVPDNALLVSTGKSSPQAVAKALRIALGAAASVEILGPDLDITAQRTAYLTGGSLTEAVGSFTYTPNADGTVEVDPAWVSANIRTERVPILGTVTCHRAMLSQMRAALEEIVDRGLADKINPGEYAGCFYPRFIANDPAQGLSLHSWGIAFDINVPGNLRGTAGDIDRTVVSIFKKWGFAWGGDWSYTDPMHFEMAAVVEPR